MVFAYWLQQRQVYWISNDHLFFVFRQLEVTFFLPTHANGHAYILYAKPGFAS